MYSPPESPAYYNTPSDDEYEGGTNVIEKNSSFSSLDSYGSNLSSNGSLVSSEEKTKITSTEKIDWFEFLVHPKKLDQHLEDLQKDNNLQPSAIDLAITFIDQCVPPTDAKSQQINDRTKRYISVVTKIAFKSNFTLDEIETKFPVPFQKHIILGILLRKRKYSGIQGIVHTSSLDKLSEIDISKIESNDQALEDLSTSYIEIIYHRWIIRSISKRLPLWFIKSPSLEGTESYDLVQLGEESLNSLEKLITSTEKNQNIFDKLIDRPSFLDKKAFSMALILDMANYYFFREEFQNSFKYLKSLNEKLSAYSESGNIESLKESCNTLIIACQSVLMANQPSEVLLLPENKKTLFFRKIDGIVDCLNNNQAEDAELSSLLIDLLIQDIIENQLSREYRVSLCYKLIEKEKLFKKILACNIIQDMVKIIQGHGIQQELETTGSFELSSVTDKSKHTIIPEGHEGVNVSVQTHLDRYVLKHKFVTSQPIIPVYIIVFLKRLEYESRSYNSLAWDNNMNSIISEFVCRLAKYVNHPIVYATLLSEGENYLNYSEENVKIFNNLMLGSVEKTYHLSYFENSSSLENQENNYLLLPRNVQEKLLTSCSEKKIENSSYFQNLKTSIVKKRVYDVAIKTNHVLFSDDVEEILKQESNSFEPLKRLKTETSDYLTLRARNLLYRNSFKSPIILHKALKLFNVSLTIDRFKQSETSKRIEFDKILLSLSKKSSNFIIPEEYAAPRIESKQIERPSPYIDCMEEFSSLCELCNLQKALIGDSNNNNTHEKTKAELKHINLVFLGELFKNLVNLGDWAFIRDFFKQVQSVYEQNNSEDENVHIVFCRFAILVESLAYHIHAPRSGAPKKVFKDLKDDIYKFVHNLIYLPDQYHSEIDSLSFEDENRLRWDDFHLLVSTNNLKFLMDLSVMLSFVLVSVRITVSGNRSSSPPTLRTPALQPTVAGHFKHLAKLIMPEYFCSSTKKHWLLGNEKFVEDTLVTMLQHVLERVVNLQDQLTNKPISTFYLFKCCLGDLYFEKGKFRKALELYLECGEMNFPHFYKPANEEVVERMFRCLVELGEYTAAAVLHQFVHSTYDNEIESQSRTHVISDNFINTNNRIGYSKEIIDNLHESNGLNERWLLYFYDLSYLELVVHIAHQKGEFNKEDLIIQHIQRSEINSNNKTDHRKEYIQSMKETFLRRLYLHVTTFLKNK